MAEKKTQRKDTAGASQSSKPLRGTVVKAAMKDTATVLVERYVQHPKYKKYMRRSKKFLVHDAGNTAQVGDVVSIKAIKPVSKRKSFTLLSIDKKAVSLDA